MSSDRMPDNITDGPYFEDYEGELEAVSDLINDMNDLNYCETIAEINPCVSLDEGFWDHYVRKGRNEDSAIECLSQ